MGHLSNYNLDPYIIREKKSICLPKERKIKTFFQLGERILTFVATIKALGLHSIENTIRNKVFSSYPYERA